MVVPSPPGYADAVLCGRGGELSPVLAAALGGGLSPGCEPCVYSPVDDGAYRFDYDNQCWLQDSASTATCPRGGDAETFAKAAAGLLTRQQTFVNYLSSATANASDLAPTFAGDVASTYKTFLNSNCGPKDLAQACYNLHQKLGRMLNEGFAANSTLQALKSLPPGDPLAPVQTSFADVNRANDCRRAQATGFTSAACLCDDAQPYLACMAQATLEANATTQALLASTVISVDPGSLKADQQAQCTDAKTGAQSLALDTTNAADVSSFLLAGNVTNPRSCCFAVPLSAGAAQPAATATASVCLTPAQNITDAFLANPVAQAANYTIPSCGYEDPLGPYGVAGADALAGWPVGMQTKLCLEGGPAVEGLKPLLPWFGTTVTAEAGKFCVDLNVNGPVYFPLKAIGLSSLQADGPEAAGVEYRLGGEMDYKVLDPAATQACISAAKSEVLNEAAKCSPACLLKAWQFERLTWQVVTGSDIYGWARGYPLLKPTVDPFTPECGDQTFFANRPPACPQPGLPVPAPAPAPAIEPPLIAPAPGPEMLSPAPAPEPAAQPPAPGPAEAEAPLPAEVPAPQPSVEPPLIAPAPGPTEEEAPTPAQAPAPQPAAQPLLPAEAPAPEPAAASPPLIAPAPGPAEVDVPPPAEAPSPQPAVESPPLIAPTPGPAEAELLPPVEAPSPQPALEPPLAAQAPSPAAVEPPAELAPAPEPSLDITAEPPTPEPSPQPPLVVPAPEQPLPAPLPGPAPAPDSSEVPPPDTPSPALQPVPQPAGLPPLVALAPEQAAPPPLPAQAPSPEPSFGITSEALTPSPGLAPVPSAMDMPQPAPAPLQGSAPSGDPAPALAPAPSPSAGPAPAPVPALEQTFADATATRGGQTSAAVSQRGSAAWSAVVVSVLAGWLMLLP
ncbi:hypothetical protein ABPG75_008149 [Micractinium tetrahymenae]